MIVPENILVSTSQGSTILEALESCKIAINHSCGGFGTCGTCRVFIELGSEILSPRNEIEMEMATDRQFTAVERLSCQTEVKNGIQVRIPIGK